MEKWYAFRDAFFWWVGVWTCVTLANHVGVKFLRKQRLKHNLLTFAEFENTRLSDENQKTQADTDTEPEPEEDA